MPNSPHYAAFAGDRLLAQGPGPHVGIAVRRAVDAGETGTILIFDDRTGRQVDFDLRGKDEDIAARFEQATASEAVAAPRSPGRPKLGVVAREVTLLPRHWAWLQAQPGGASATLRRLVEAARKRDAPAQRDAQQAADRFMTAMLGNRAGYEEAARALYARDRERFYSLSEDWPADLRDYARQLAEPAFPTEDTQAA